MRNLIFTSVGPGPGTIPIRRGPCSDLDIVEVLWHPDTIRDHSLGLYETDADVVLIDTDRTKRKMICFAEAWLEGRIRRDYNAILIADDDLEPYGCYWDDIFSLFHESGLNVAQPALSPDSTGSWIEFVRQKPGVRWRITDMVEVMCPIIRGGCVPRMLDALLEEKNGWGLESLWRAHFAPIGILDETPIRHVRPVGSAHAFSGLDMDPAERAGAFRAKHRLTYPCGIEFYREIKS